MDSGQPKHHHSHHQHHIEGATEDGLKKAFWINLLFTLLAGVGGYFGNSVALLADAVHDLGDSVSLGLAWMLERKSKKEANRDYTYGYGRLSLLGAFINAVILLLGGAFIIYESIRRINTGDFNPDANIMLIFGILGIFFNVIAVRMIGKTPSKNSQVVTWHLIEDVLGWLAIIVGAFIMKIWNVPIIDPILSIFISLFISWNVIRHLTETVRLFLQGTPKDISVSEVEKMLERLPGVESHHHTHVWSLDGANNVLSTHLVVHPELSIDQEKELKNRLREKLENFHFQHSTIEIERDRELCSASQSGKKK